MHISFDKGFVVEEIDREKAKALISAYDLSLAHSDNNGRVWDTSNHSFKEMISKRPEVKNFLISLINNVAYSE